MTAQTHFDGLAFGTVFHFTDTRGSLFVKSVNVLDEDSGEICNCVEIGTGELFYAEPYQGVTVPELVSHQYA